MSITAGVATIAIVALGATYALVGLPDETTTRPTAAISPDAVGDDWSFFSGTLTYDGSSAGNDPGISVVNGLIIEEGRGWSSQSISTSDPRMTGTRDQLDTSFRNLAGGLESEPGSIWANVATVRTDMGAWSCRLEGVEVGDLVTEAGWCTGSGGLEGLRAYISSTSVPPVAGRTVPVAGYITNGEGPPAPEPE